MRINYMIIVSVISCVCATWASTERRLSSRVDVCGSSRRVVKNMNELRRFLPRGRGTVPESVESMCPTVAAHFKKFPLFEMDAEESLKHLDVQFPFPISDTIYAASGTCLLFIASGLASSIGSTLLLYAGGHLGAVLHGGPIPYDDDIDAMLPRQDQASFLNACAQVNRDGTLPVNCHVHKNAIKLFFTSSLALRNSSITIPWTSPYIDVFLYTVNNNRVVEVSPNGIPRGDSFTYPLEEFFPTQPYYFGGIYVHGPNEKLARRRYDLDKCKLSRYNHRKEVGVSKSKSIDLDCCELKQFLPFINGTVLSNGAVSESLIRFSAWAPKVILSAERRHKLFSSPERKGQFLTDSLTHLDTVEIVNAYSDGCSELTRLHVVEFNMARGIRWLEASDVLDDIQANIIILNEMDYGMSRSNQQHVTRLLAQKFAMNYAWGLEFVELTRGDAREQNFTANTTDFYGLHGNAILTRCHINQAHIFRDPIGKYFSREPNDVNANGFETRLGGRMALVAELSVGKLTINAISTHKLSSMNVVNQLRRHCKESLVVLAGDQDMKLCNKLNLQSIPSQNTWPASCSTLGSVIGDRICTNMHPLHKDATVQLPCLQTPMGEIVLSDHAILNASVLLPR